MGTILIADDHPLFREAMRLTVGVAVGGRGHEIAEAGTIADVVRHAEADDDVDLVLLDLRMPGMEGFAGLIDLRRRFPALPVVIVSATEDRATMLAALTYGASGFIPKSLTRDEIGRALARVLDGEVFAPPGLDPSADDAEAADDAKTCDVARGVASLTPQQRRVLRLMGQGKPNKIIAFELDIGETTVKAHITSILRKLRVHSRTQAVLATRGHLDADAA